MKTFSIKNETDNTVQEVSLPEKFTVGGDTYFDFGKLSFTLSKIDDTYTVFSLLREKEKHEQKEGSSDFKATGKYTYLLGGKLGSSETPIYISHKYETFGATKTLTLSGIASEVVRSRVLYNDVLSEKKHTLEFLDTPSGDISLHFTSDGK
jgi:hypothetical protein